tara:strand:+ start:3245 stop:3913 length:669 start_codon:yes stop_codon:yes gene_type:complete
MDLSKFIDHTKLGHNVNVNQINKLVEEAIKYNFKSVCVNPTFVSHVSKKLKDTDVCVCTVIGFPHGQHIPEVKSYEAEKAINDGADELDMVLNLNNVYERNEKKILLDIQSVLKKTNGKILKVIIETCYLSDEEIKYVSNLVMKSGAHFVKTSTGFGTSGASYHDIKLIKSIVGDNCKIKASGGIKDYKDAIKYIDLGVNRIGTSKGVVIVTGKEDSNDSTY